MNKALEFLKTTDWEYKEVPNDQYNIKVCPLCKDERNKFYMSKEGLWDCKICGNAGNLYQLKTKIGGIDDIMNTAKLFADKKELDSSIINEYIEELKENKEAYEYLTKVRKFTDKTINFFKLGSENDWIMIPHFQDGKLWNIKSRNFKQKDFRRISGQPSILFNIDNINPKRETLVIVEGETDCMATWQLGVENVVGLTVGAGTFLPEWIPYTLKFKEIIICLNSDVPGQRGARKIAEKLGETKCKNVVLPTKDVNDFLLERSREEFITLLKEAKPFDIQNISSVSEFIKKIDDWFIKDGALSGMSLPFPAINNMVKGFKEEDLILLTGDTSVGKTTLSLNLLHSFLNQGKRCLGFFLEGKVMYYLLRMMSMESGIKIEELNADPEKWENLKNKFVDYPMFIYSGTQSDLNITKLSKLLQIAIQAHDIDFVVIDHLQKIVKDDRDVVQEYSRVVSTLKDLAVDLKIPILLIAHIRKPDNERKRINMHDVKSSSTIYQEADIFLALWNKNNEDAEPDLYLSILKNRMGESGDFRIVYEKETGVIRERIENIDKEPIRKKIKKEQPKDKAEELDVEIDETIE
ncbi:MAG: DnaB-like helicase C-terminal domain-containing protein [Candidatus Pacearchaeota archaeon]